MQSGLPWDDLRLVLAIGQAGGLSGAAQLLGVNHSTVFRRLGDMEQRLGVRLFDRLRDGYAPTAAGEATIALAGRMAEQVEALERRLAGEDMRPSGIVRVTTTDTLMLGFLPEAFAAFRAKHPEIMLEVAANNAFLNLNRRDADVAIRPSATPPDSLVGRRIATIGTAVYAATAYLERHGTKPDTPAAFAEQDWIAPDDSLSHLASAQWLRTEMPTVKLVYRTNSLLGLHAAARNGLGLAALPCFLGDPDPALVRLMPPNPALDSALWLLTHPDLRHVARIRTLLDFLAEWLTARRGLLEGSSRG